MQTVSDPTPASGAEENIPAPELIPDSSSIVQIDHISKRYRGVSALRNVSFNIQSGEIFGLLGPNGAGKSTLLKLIMGFLSADSGTIQLFGSNDLSAAHARIGYLPEQPRYHSNFTGREYMQFQARLAGLSAHDARTVVSRALKAVGIEEAANRRIRTYSKGMRQRLGLAVALSVGGGTPPELLVLDEPASGLAPEGQIAVREVLLDCQRQGSTILLCSHQLTDVERICSEVGILRGGRLVALTRLHDESRVMITATPRPRAMEVAPQLLEYLEQLHPSVALKGGERADEPLYVSLPTGSGVPHAAAMKAAAIRALVDARWDITSVHIENRDLESIYLQAVRPPAKDKDSSPDGKPAEIAVASDKANVPVETSVVEIAPSQVAPETPVSTTAEREVAYTDGLPEAPVMPVISEPLPVRPVSSNGSVGLSDSDSAASAPSVSSNLPVETYGDTSQVVASVGRTGPATTPLPALLEMPDPRTELPANMADDPWRNDLRREGEGR